VQKFLVGLRNRLYGQSDDEEFAAGVMADFFTPSSTDVAMIRRAYAGLSQVTSGQAWDILDIWSTSDRKTSKRWVHLREQVTEAFAGSDTAPYSALPSVASTPGKLAVIFRVALISGTLALTTKDKVDAKRALSVLENALIWTRSLPTFVSSAEDLA
jgi:hypothetical protein